MRNDRQDERTSQVTPVERAPSSRWQSERMLFFKTSTLQVPSPYSVIQPRVELAERVGCNHALGRKIFQLLHRFG